MKHIKLMADYYCYPLWENSPEKTGNIDPRTLNLSESLIKKIMAWASFYDSTLNTDDPVNSGFNSNEDEELFIKNGEEILNKMKGELGSDYTISFKYTKQFLS